MGHALNLKRPNEAQGRAKRNQIPADLRKSGPRLRLEQWYKGVPSMCEVLCSIPNTGVGALVQSGL